MKMQKKVKYLNLINVDLINLMTKLLQRKRNILQNMCVFKNFLLYTTHH